MFQIAVASVTSELRDARHAIRNQLASSPRVDPAHVGALEVVANELLGAAFESGFREPLVLRVELFTLLTSVRVRCTGDVELRDEPFGMRERVLQGLAFAWGKRTYADGSVDLWAEVARPAVEKMSLAVV